MSIDKLRNIGLDKLVTQVYDFDSLTTDELMCKFAQKINIIIEHFKYLDDRCYNADKAMEEKLQYLLGEGLEEQVAKRLIVLVDNGTLGDLINQTLLKNINDKVENNTTEIQNINNKVVTNINEIENLSNNRLMIDKINPYTNKLGYITPEMFGEINNGDDVTSILQNCINYAIENNVKVVFTNNKEYCFTNLTIDRPCSVDFNNAILKCYISDPNTSLLNIGLESDSFDTKTEYSSKFNISNILIDLNNKEKKYGVEINCRHIRINRIVVKNAVNNAVYCGGNDGIWIEQILCFGNNISTTSKGVIINCNDIILGNVECAYFKHGVFVKSALNDIEIDKLHVWSDVEESSCIAYGSTTFYGHINSLIIDCTNYGIDLKLVDGYGKLSIDNIMVFPSTKFTDWQIVKEKFQRQSMGITIGTVYGINDSDTTLRFQNYYGIVKSLPNYNQKPKLYAEYSNMSGSGHFFEQINGFLYQTEFAKIVISEAANRINLGYTTGINKLWRNFTIPVVILGADYNPISANAVMYIREEEGFELRLSTSLTGTYYIKLGCPLPIGYYY